MTVQLLSCQSCVELAPIAVIYLVLLEVMKITLKLLPVEVKKVVPLGLQVADGQRAGWLKDSPRRDCDNEQKQGGI